VFLTFLTLALGIFARPQGLRNFKTSRPSVPEDAADRTTRRLAAEKDKQKKDAEKARARERMWAREALEKRRRRQARDGLPLEPSPDTPDDDDDDDEDNDMAARLDLSPDPRLGQGSSSQPLGGLAPPVFGAGTPGSRSEERRRAEGVLDPLAEIIGVTPEGQADPHPSREQVPTIFLCILILSFLPFSKQRQGSAGLAPTKALKTGPASSAGAAARHAGWLASAQGTLRRGA
jgi:hypothetical protein